MTTIAEAYVQLKPSMRGFTSDMNNQVGGEMNSLGDRHGRSYGGSFGSAFKAIGGVAIIATIASIGISAVKTGLETAASMEQAKIAFTTMLGSAEKADGFLKQLADFAAQTPFEFPELQTAASSLISSGVAADKVIPIMKTLGNSTAGMGTGADGIKRATVALQQMAMKGKITGEEMMQLSEAGVDGWGALSAATGKSTAELMKLSEQGKLGKDSLNQLMSAIESGKGFERFTGLMDQQSQSLSGLMATFKDNLGIGLAKAVEPLIPLLKDGLGKTAEWLGNTAMPAMANGIKAAIDFLGPIVESVRMFWGAFTGEGYDMEGSADKINGLIDAGATARYTFDGFASVMNTQVLPTLKAIGDWIMTHIAPSVMELVAAFQRAYDVISPIVTQLVTGIMEKVGPLMPTIIGIFTGIGQVIADIISIVATHVRESFNALALFWQEWGGPITGFLSNTFSFIVNIIAAAVDYISGIIHAVMLAVHGDWSGAWKAIEDATGAAWGHLASAFNDGVAAVWSIVKHLGTVIGDEFAKLWKGATDLGGNIVQGIANGISGGIQWVVDAAKKVAGAALQAVKDFLGIKSPSTVMENQVGFQMAAGIGVGITRGGGLIDSAMNDLVSRATGPIGISASGSLTGGPGSGDAYGQGGPLELGAATIDAFAGAVINGASVTSQATLANDKWSSGMGRETRGRAW